MSEPYKSTCQHCGVTKTIYSTGCEEFESAIKKFGIDAALEYFSTPAEIHHIFEDLKEKADE